MDELKVTNRIRRPGPVVFCIMDGVGIGKYADGDAVAAADMRCLKSLMKTCPTTLLKAHGTAVGLPSDADMGNSEVGHNAFGAGRVFAQGAKLVDQAIEGGGMFNGKTWDLLCSNVRKNNSTLHFLGLVSDGNVHSNIAHLYKMLDKAAEIGIRRVRIHALLDGRDVGERSALDYILPLEKYIKEKSSKDFDIAIASGGGRMKITMDRYNADWNMVGLGWKTHVLGEARGFKSASEAIETYRKETNPVDQYLDPFVVLASDGKPCGTINDGDSVILFNFRGDRAIEISRAFEEEDFKEFDRVRFPKVMFAGMMEADGDLHIPHRFLVNPPLITQTFPEALCNAGVRQLSISETQKYGHVTYFFNGNRSGKFSAKLEDYVEIKSDNVPFQERPWMKCAEIADYVIDKLHNGDYRFIKLNFPNGDMVGHTGNFQAVECSLEAMDLQMERIRKAVEEVGGVLIVTADHGNSDDMIEHDKNGKAKIDANGAAVPKTSHSLNPVPFVIYDPLYAGEYDRKLNEGLGISSCAATILQFLGFEPLPIYDKSIINLNP